jgi:signal transduction histidine kinase
MYRWLAVLRLVLVVNAVGLNIYRGGFAHPVGGGLLLAGMVVWTGVISWVYSSFRRRTTAWVVADLAVALASLALTAAVKEPGFHSTVPGFWIMGAMFAWAIHWRLYGGLVAAVLLSLCDLLTRQYLSETVYGNLFLLLIGGPIVGLMVDSLLRSAARTAAAERAAAAAVERSRLARAVHDGVLQVLGLVQRRGVELGGEAAELGRLAGQQESALRTLIREQDQVRPAHSGTADLASALLHLERPGVDIVTSGRVELPTDVASELVAAVAACLDNVARHAGPEGRAWVLLEGFADRVEISVRDEGPGIPAGRLEEAAADGRLGVSQSIVGRVADLGGTATVTTGADGTEWELVLPRSTAPNRSEGALRAESSRFRGDPGRA